MNKTKKYTFLGYKVLLTDLGYNAKQGKHQVDYTLITPDNTMLFSGNDFFASPLHSPTSKESALALMGFLTCKPGDVEPEYFDGYTESQLAWANSFACEQLSCYIATLEER